MRRGTGSLYRRLKSAQYLFTRDRTAVLRFLTASLDYDFRTRLRLLWAFEAATHGLRGYHSQAELLTVAGEILRRRAPLVLECGTGKGSSTAKLSWATRLAGGRLVAFDSFRGIPPNDEVHQHLDGRRIVFRSGAFTGRKAEVERNVAQYGAPEVTTLVKGWFAETLPRFEGRPDVVLLDVDLLSSTRTCLVHLFSKLAPDGVVFSQDGHLMAIVELLRNPNFWRDEVGVPPPVIEGLGTQKLLVIRPA